LRSLISQHELNELLCDSPTYVFLVKEEPHDADIGLLRVCQDILKPNYVDGNLGVQVEFVIVVPYPKLISSELPPVFLEGHKVIRMD